MSEEEKTYERAGRRVAAVLLAKRAAQYLRMLAKFSVFLPSFTPSAALSRFCSREVTAAGASGFTL